MSKQILVPQGLLELGSDPATPAAGTLLVYAKTDHKTYQRDSTGTVTDLTATGGAGGGSNTFAFFMS
jgi:hypothetical protein